MTDLSLVERFKRERSKSINQSTLFNEGDTQQTSTDKPVAFEFPIELELTRCRL